MGDILCVTVFVAAVIAVPAWPWSRRWGWGPSGIILVFMVAVLIMKLVGRI